MTFPVDVLSSAPGSVPNLVRVAGGGAPGASASTATTISEEPAGFGVSPGSASTALSSVQAGAHPDITTSVAFNTVNTRGSLAGDPDEIVTEEPSGFAGDLVNTPTCAPETFNRGEMPDRYADRGHDPVPAVRDGIGHEKRSRARSTIFAEPGRSREVRVFCPKPVRYSG